MRGIKSAWDRMSGVERGADGRDLKGGAESRVEKEARGFFRAIPGFFRVPSGLFPGSFQASSGLLPDYFWAIRAKFQQLWSILRRPKLTALCPDCPEKSFCGAASRKGCRNYAVFV